MELPGSGYLYTLATLAMTFVGFCAIVLVFRQSMGAQSSKFHRYASHVYLELGLTSAAFAMLAPLLAACDLPTELVWRVSSALIAVALIVHSWLVLKRFKANRPGPFPRRVWFNTTVTVLVIVALLANGADFLIRPGLGPVAVAATWRLMMGVEIFMLTLEEFLEKSV
jgi:hypothetical protein